MKWLAAVLALAALSVAVLLARPSVTDGHGSSVRQSYEGLEYLCADLPPHQFDTCADALADLVASGAITLGTTH